MLGSIVHAQGGWEKLKARRFAVPVSRKGNNTGVLIQTGLAKRSKRLVSRDGVRLPDLAIGGRVI